MENYMELYDDFMLNLQGIFNCMIEKYSSFYFHVELRSVSFDAFNSKFAGTCEFCISENYIEQYCEQLRNMYDLLQGECLIVDYDFGNELKLFFEGRQLKIEGKFYDGRQLLRFSGEVDQTIIPRLLSLLQTN